MFEEEDDEDYLEIVSLTDDNGVTYNFQVIEEVELDDKTYLITIPEENYDEQGELVVILDEDSELTIVDDEDILDRIQEHLEEITLGQEISSITILGKDGKRYEYDVVDRMYVEDKEYLFTVDINAPDNDYVIFEAKDNQLIMIEDQKMHDELIDQFDNKADYEYYTSDYDYEDSKITLQDSNNNTIEINILGKLEIKSNKYMIGSRVEDNKLVAILINSNDELSLIKDNMITDEVNYYLRKIREVIDQKPSPYPELN